ncbi:MAG: sigma-70 family RNA polymerase sigma factor [Spirochaetes bacterium]|nr:sigma-70 family RNA polymerase sigma factor [Spirochaetota bacterium]
MHIDVEQLYETYGPMVLRRCRFLLKDEDKALDAMQDVFVQVLKKKEQLNGTYPSSLLFTMATNICLNRIRYEKRHRTISNETVIENKEFIDNFEKKLEARDLLERIFASHKESTRLIAFLHFVDGLTLEEVAREVDLSVSGVRKRLRLLKQTATKALKEKSNEKKSA